MVDITLSNFSLWTIRGTATCILCFFSAYQYIFSNLWCLNRFTGKNLYEELISLQFPPEGLTEAEKYRLVEIDYNYSKRPTQKRKRDSCTLKQETIIKHKRWLVVGENGGVCKACKLFIKIQDLPNTYGRLLNKPWTQYSRVKDLDDHAQCRYHQNAIIAMDNYVRIVVTRSGTSVKNQLDKALMEASRLTIDRLNSLIRSVVFCARQGIAFRGHRNESTPFLDHSQIPPHIIPGDVNRGNFLMLLDQRIQAGDTKLTKSKNLRTQYTSPSCVNELISLTADQVLKSVIREVQTSKVFSVIADETRDVSNTEQLCVAVRYFDVKNCRSEEKFLGFVALESLRGKFVYPWDPSTFNIQFTDKICIFVFICRH